jgi:type I restriction-modification system DNA methylase subunit
MTDGNRKFINTFIRLTYYHSPYNVWDDFVTQFACRLSNEVDEPHRIEREELYLKTINKYNQQERGFFKDLIQETKSAFIINPCQDFLGTIFMELDFADVSKGQFFTPYSICRCMAEFTVYNVFSRIKEKGYITINDPCCGAGATLIAGVNEAKQQLRNAGLNFQNYILASAQDIDRVCALMCYIQLYMLGVAAYVKVGNALTNPISTMDTLENYWFTRAYFNKTWLKRRELGGDC